MSTYAYDQLVTAIQHAHDDAGQLKGSLASGGHRGIDAVVYRLADAIAADDPKFDEDAFFGATRTPLRTADYLKEN